MHTSGDFDIEYLRINIEDNTDVPIKLSFSVAYEFLENALSECKLKARLQSIRNNALVDDNFTFDKQWLKENQFKMKSAALLTPIEVDFSNNETNR